MNARTTAKDSEEQTVELRITPHMQISCTPALPQRLWPYYSNQRHMNITTDQKQSSVEYLKTLLLQERYSNW